MTFYNFQPRPINRRTVAGYVAARGSVKQETVADDRFNIVRFFLSGVPVKEKKRTTVTSRLLSLNCTYQLSQGDSVDVAVGVGPRKRFGGGCREAAAEGGQ